MRATIKLNVFYDGGEYTDEEVADYIREILESGAESTGSTVSDVMIQIDGE